MTPVFGLFTVALLLIYAGVKNRSPFDVIAGIGSEIVNPASVDDTVDIATQESLGDLTDAAGAGTDDMAGTSPLGTTTIDGKPVPNWMAKYILKARKKKLWLGTITSGVRTPEYSEQLCYQMCGQPTCPGTCAGRSSNHNCSKGCPYPNGAVDVTNPEQFAAAMRKLGAPIRNALPNDPVHFSASGH